MASSRNETPASADQAIREAYHSLPQRYDDRFCPQSSRPSMIREPNKNVFSSDMLVRFSPCDPAGIIFYPHYFVMFNGLVEDWFNHALNIDYAGFITNRRLG